MNKSSWFVAGLALTAGLFVAFIATRRTPSEHTPDNSPARQTAAAQARLPSAPAGAPLTSPPGRSAPLGVRPPTASAGRAFTAFNDWAQAYLAATNGAGRAKLEAGGVGLARARRQALAALIKTDPQRALELAVPWAVRQALPAPVSSQLEQPVSGRGDFQVFAAVPLPGQLDPVTPITRYVTLQNRTYQAYVYGRRRRQTTKAHVPLHGIAVDSDLAVHEDPGRVLEAAEARALPAAGAGGGSDVCAVCGRSSARLGQETWLDYGGTRYRFCQPAHAVAFNRRLGSAADAPTLPDGGIISTNFGPVVSSQSQGTKTLLFMRVRFPDDPTEPITESTAYALMNDVNRYFVEASYHTTAIISTVTPLLMLPQVKLWYGTNGPGALQADARSAAKAAGLDYRNYDLDIVRHVGVPGFKWGGLAAVGGRGVWLQADGLGVAAHELGHNYGLFHANFWNTVRPPLTVTYPDNPGNLPFDPDSLIGHDSVIGPGLDAEYGDSFDIMGGGGGHYNVIAKHRLNWLPDPYVQTVAQDGTNRLYAFDVPALTLGRVYALKIRKDSERNYWAEFRSQILDNPWLQSGIELHWDPWSQTDGGSQLLDTTPGTPPGRGDSALVVGRTFTDATANVHITPVAKGGSAPDRWIDVVVNVGPFPNNLPPTVALTATTNQTATNATVTFTATASDPNGDPVAFDWDFGDGTFGANTNAVSKSWSAEGDYVVRCEVSDMKGGVASAAAVIRVGAPTTFRISGRVIDAFGNPVPGVRVHNGETGTNGFYGPDYRWTFTDSQGRYTLVNLAAGTYTNAAFRFGYRTAPLDFFNPITLSVADATEINYLAVPLPQVGVATNAFASENVPNSGNFTVSRTGPTNQAQVVVFQVSGTAAANVDYQPPTNEVTVTLTNIGMNEAFGDMLTNVLKFNAVTIPAGARSTNLAINPVNDTVFDGTKTLTLTVALPMQALGFLADTNITGSAFCPGWEALPLNNQPVLYQSYPDYALADGAGEATLAILDPNPPTPPTVSIATIEDLASENGAGAGLMTVTRFGGHDAPLTVDFTVSGSAVPGRDYLPLPDSVTIPAGVSSINLPIVALDNLYVDGNKTVVVALATNAAYTIGSATATVTILGNDPPVVTLDAPQSVASKNLTGTGTFTVTRSGSVSQDLEVNYLVTGTATSGTDYTPLSGSVTIPAGNIAANITVTPLDNRFIGGSKTVAVYLSSSPAYDIGTPNAATVVIEDSTLPTVNLVATGPTAVEPNTPGEFTLTRTGDLSADLVVNFETSGTAIPQARYAAIGNSARIPAGADRVAIPINPIDDPYREDDQTIILKLVPSPAYNLGLTNQATVIVQDNDSGAFPYVGFTLVSSSGPEAVSPVHLVVMISASPAAGQDVVVDYQATGGTATQGVDFLLSTNHHLTFTNGGPTIQDIPLTILDNKIPQPNRTILMTLLDPAPILTNVVVTNQVPNPQDPSQTTNQVVTNVVAIPVPTNAFIGVYKTHTYTILDDDLAVVTIQATDPNAIEAGPKPGRFTVTRLGSTNVDLTVNFQVTGTASSGTDFVPLGNSVTIRAGTNAVDIPLVPIDDRTEELPETVKVTLIDAPGAQIGSPDNATVLIQNVDGTLEFTAPAYAADENTGRAVITVQRTGDTNVPVTVDYATRDGTATAGLDYLPTAGTLSFAPGVTVQSFSIPLLDDLLVETNETILLTLRNPTGGVPLGGQSQAVLTIVDNDTAFRFASTNFLVNENGTNAVITVQRIGVSTNRVTVDYATGDGTATAGTKYVAQNGTLSFAAGETAKTFLVPILDNAIIDGDQTVNLTLSNPTGGASLTAPGTAALTIVDDDCALAFDTNAASVLEYAGTVTLNVRRLGGTVNPVRVDFATRDGTARQGSNYVAQGGTLNFAGDAYLPSTNGTGIIEFHPGQTNQTITVPILDNTAGNGDQTFYVLLSNATGPKTGALPGSAVLGQPTNATVTIVDDEAPGFVDYQFDPRGGANGRVLAVGLETDGRVLLGGEFTAIDGINFSRVARLHANGYLDSGFNPGAGADGAVSTVAAQTDGKVLIGGAFTSFDSTNRNRLARLNADGSLDLSFDPGTGANDLVRCLAIQTDGKVLIGGDFTSINFAGANHLARLNADGSVDGTFNPGAGANGPVYSIAVQTDGRVLVAGAFARINGAGANGLARLNADGSVDSTFNPGAGADGPVYSIAVQTDGGVLAGGAFSTINGAGFNRVARLNPDGSPDSGFHPGTGADGTVYSVAALPDGKVFIGGAFTQFNGSNLNRFARLNNDGSLDAGFNAGSGANGTVYSAAAQPDTALLIGGEFTVVNGLNRNRVARLHGDEKFTFGVVQFSSAVYQVSETNGLATVTVQRTGNPTTAFSVDYATSDGTAQAGAKYVAQTGTLAFAPGETEQAFTIPIINENTAEGNETVNLVLSNPTPGGALGSRNTAVLVIIDDESAVAFSLPEYSVPENAGAATVAVQRTGNTSGTATVDYATRDGTATAGLDYEAQSGTLTFGVGETNLTITIPIRDDQLIETNETILLTLANPTGGLSLGNQSNAVLTILDNDAVPRFFNLTLIPAPGGTVAPPSGQYPTNSIQVLTATPDRNYEFVDWEGALFSAANPLFLRLDRDYSLTARFRVKQPSDTFESGDLSALPWTTAGGAPWFVQSGVAAAGRFAARSGLIGDNQQSSLMLTATTLAGTGSFDFRVSSESGWDFLEFYLNGLRLQRWSGEVGWQNFQFPVPAGINHFEWRYTKDANFSAGLDAGFVDNVFIPLGGPDPTPPAAVLDIFHLPGGALLLQLNGQAGRNYVVEVSTNLADWQPLGTNLLPANVMFQTDPPATNYPARFYRAVTP